MAASAILDSSVIQLSVRLPSYRLGNFPAPSLMGKRGLKHLTKLGGNR